MRFPCVSDEVQLEFSLSQGRVIFTQDTDFLRLNQSNINHLGIVYCPQQTKIYWANYSRFSINLGVAIT
ncbi:DUF5615 family PIN-like protein [Anabaena azotica]|uniref:DUF5615 family PIN-like protein n=1 Tax=Anabaena azotica TaxID=197653 RepID=UPI0039A62094